MAYRLKPNPGESIAVPQLVFSRMAAAEENALRVALYILATGVTDPEQIARELKLRSVRTAESLLQWWCGAGLLENTEAAPPPPEKPAPLTWTEIMTASRADPTIANLVECAQRCFGSGLGHKDTQILAGLYLQEGYDPEVIMLCLTYVSARGRRTVGGLRHELTAWRNAGVETGEQADAYLTRLDTRRRGHESLCALLNLRPDELTLGQKKAIDRWHETYGFDDEMIAEAVLQAGEKKADIWYLNGILKAWNGRGLRSIHDVRGGGTVQPAAGHNVRVDRGTQTAVDLAGLGLNRPRRLKRED